jgi:hypothetical protein
LKTLTNKTDIVATITDDYRLDYAIPRALVNRLQELGAGNRVRVDIKLWRKPRSIRQNAYLWSVVYPTIIHYIKDTTGQEFTAEDLHERYKRKYLGYEVCDIPGMEDLIRPKSSTELDMESFWLQLIEHIAREWAELGLYIELPREKQEEMVR